jgi:hypothetical protein
MRKELREKVIAVFPEYLHITSDKILAQNVMRRSSSPKISIYEYWELAKEA